MFNLTQTTMDNYYYVVVDSLGEYVRAFKDYNRAESFWISRGGAMSCWKIVKCVSKY